MWRGVVHRSMGPVGRKAEDVKSPKRIGMSSSSSASSKRATSSSSSNNVRVQGMTSLCGGPQRAGIFVPACYRHVAQSGVMGACCQLKPDSPPPILISPYKTRSHKPTGTRCRNPRPIALSSRGPLARNSQSKYGGKYTNTFLQRTPFGCTRSIELFSTLY
jgi:hypothetical protein